MTSKSFCWPVRVCVMIFDGDHFNLAGGSSKEFAEQLAERVKAFKGDSLAKDAWLLVSWERTDSENPNDWWQFRYFTIGKTGLREGI